MAFGIPNSDGGGGGGNKFLGRIQFDARVGSWLIVKRIQHSDGSYGDSKGQPFFGTEKEPLSLLMDFGSLDVGYIKLTSPPSFLVVPYGQAIPPQPEELTAPDANGKTRKAFLPGFRVQVASTKIFGDRETYYFSGTSKSLLGPMDALHEAFKASSEAAAGMIPLVVIKRCIATENKTPQGTSTFYGPDFEIVSWVPRPPVFGDRTVPSPTAGARADAAAQAPRPPVTNHVPPPVPPVAVKPAPAMALADEEVPF